MAIVIHEIKGHFYAYEHTREGDKVVTRYLYPVDAQGERRLYEKGEEKPNEVKQQVKEEFTQQEKENMSASEWQEWMNKKSKEYGGANKFYASEEYKQNYSYIDKSFREAHSKYAEKGRTALKEENIKEGDRVVYVSTNPWGMSEEYHGKVYVDKTGVPKVRLDDGKRVTWNRGFTKE